MTWTTLKRARGLTAWLLAVFLLRSLIPVGFMPMIGPGHSVQLALCDGYGPVPSMDMSMDPRMDMSQPGHATHQDHGTCLFGSSPALGAPLTVSAQAAMRLESAAISALSAQILHHEVPYRAQSARGPPV
jgi:Protein of unknown function (DUF2946)